MGTKLAVPDQPLRFYVLCTADPRSACSTHVLLIIMEGAGQGSGNDDDDSEVLMHPKK